LAGIDSSVMQRVSGPRRGDAPSEGNKASAGRRI
jgi:hypothetical protein